MVEIVDLIFIFAPLLCLSLNTEPRRRRRVFIFPRGVKIRSPFRSTVGRNLIVFSVENKSKLRYFQWKQRQTLRFWWCFCWWLIGCWSPDDDDIGFPFETNIQTVPKTSASYWVDPVGQWFSSFLFVPFIENFTSIVASNALEVYYVLWFFMLGLILTSKLKDTVLTYSFIMKQHIFNKRK